jgi:protoporphyrinogen oxidase
VRAAAERLKYRDFMTVALVIDREHVFPDNWIYIHDSRVHVGRIQNFKNWSPDMVPDAKQTCLGLEYFCSEGDHLWSMRDEDLVELGKRELATIGLVDPALICDGVVLRVPKAYPVYDDGYKQALSVVREYLARFENLQLIGRNGSHKYNNQDHSMLMAILAVRNVFGESHDLWAINADDEYQEEQREPVDENVRADVRRLATTQPLVPSRITAEHPRVSPVAES